MELARGLTHCAIVMIGVTTIIVVLNMHVYRYDINSSLCVGGGGGRGREGGFGEGGRIE